MVFLKLVHIEYQVNHKTQLFWVKVVQVSDGADWHHIAKSKQMDLLKKVINKNLLLFKSNSFLF